jgi:RES domain-containing protein
MIVWRISNYADLRGLGGLRAEARWHNAGRPIVYLADHPASAMLEMLVHSELRQLPDTFTLLEVEVPEALVVHFVDENSLPHDWRRNLTVTRAIGDAWLASNISALLRVPSALAKNAWNLLLNPMHPDADQCAILHVLTAPLDPRFKP